MQQRIYLADETWATLALHEHFNVPNNVEDVLWAAFDWYFVPKSSDRIAYAKRVVAYAFALYQETCTFPDWLWRVYALTIEGKTFDEGLMPPPDPKDLPSP